MSGEPAAVVGRVVDVERGVNIVTLVALVVVQVVVVLDVVAPEEQVEPITVKSKSLAAGVAAFFVAKMVQSVRVAGHTMFVCEQVNPSFEA